MHKFYIIINIFVLLINTGSIALAKEDSFAEGELCTQQEDVYFNCILENQKIVSICKNGSNSEKHYVQYRYGTPDNIEMKYPKKLLPAKGHIFYANESGGSVSSASLFFQAGLYRYVIYDTEGNQGMYVEKGKPTDMDKKSVFLQDCTGVVYTGAAGTPWEKAFQDGKEYLWTGENKPM